MLRMLFARHFPHSAFISDAREYVVFVATAQFHSNGRRHRMVLSIAAVPRLDFRADLILGCARCDKASVLNGG